MSLQQSDPAFREGQMKRLMAYMIETSKIEHVGRNKYSRNKDIVNMAIEKLIVNLFANKSLKEMISPGDYPAAPESIFYMYKVDRVKMFRYARRRNKETDLKKFLQSRTNVELKVG